MQSKNKTYPTPPIAWLWITDYMHGWLQYELGCEARIGERRVVCVQHLEGARAVLRMKTEEDMAEPKRTPGMSLSPTRYNCYREGLRISPDVMQRDFGVTAETLDLYVPIECPKMRLTANGVLRPWNLDTSFGKEQARELQALLRTEFWKAVAEFDREYAEGAAPSYPAKEMLEQFCATTNTPDIYVEAMRREWQRRKKAKEKLCAARREL